VPATLSATDRFGNTFRLSVPTIVSVPPQSPRSSLTSKRKLSLPLGLGGPALIVPASDIPTDDPLLASGLLQPSLEAGASAVTVDVRWRLTAAARTRLLATAQGAFAAGLDVALQFDPPTVPTPLAAHAKAIEVARLVRATGARTVIVRGAATLPPSTYLRLATVIRTRIRASTPTARVYIETPSTRQPAFLGAIGAAARSTSARLAAFDGLVLRLPAQAMTPDLRLPPPAAPTLTATTYGRLRYQLRKAFRNTSQSPRLPIIVAGVGRESVTALRAAACAFNVTGISISQPPTPRNHELARVAKLARNGSLTPCDRIPSAPALLKASMHRGQTGMVLACQRDCRYTIALINHGSVVTADTGVLEGGVAIRVGWPHLPLRNYKALIATAPRFGQASPTTLTLRIKPRPAPPQRSTAARTRRAIAGGGAG
jgi:hypothetical protein